MVSLRPLTAEDVPQTVDLRLRCYETSAHDSPTVLGTHFKRVFLENPWRREGIDSIVAEDEGQIVGFMGVVPRPMIFQGKEVWASVPTQLMVAPEARGGRLARKIMSECLNGPQDLTYTDLATPPVRRLWDSVGAPTLVMDSLYWTWPARPAKVALAALARQGLPRPMALLGKAFALPADAVLWRARKRSPDPAGIEFSVVDDVSASTLVGAFEALPESYGLAPRYSEQSLQWLLDCLSVDLGGSDRLRCVVGRDNEGKVRSWCLYVLRPRDIARVLQVGGPKDLAQAAIERTVQDAHGAGCSAVHGRVQPDLVEVEAVSPGFVNRNGPWVVAHAREPDLAAQLSRPDTWLTLLEGESWMSF